MKIIQSLLVASFVFVFFYLLSAFYSMTFDISKWTEFTRYIVSFFGGMFGIISGLLTYFKDKL